MIIKDCGAMCFETVLSSIKQSGLFWYALLWLRHWVREISLLRWG